MRLRSIVYLKSAVLGAIVARVVGVGRRIIGCRMTLVTTHQRQRCECVWPRVAAGDSPARFHPPDDTISRYMAKWATRLGLNREALLHSLRTAVATVVSLLLARALKLAEFYWAPISTIVILLSVTDPLAL